jgi:hypothetical protein
MSVGTSTNSSRLGGRDRRVAGERDRDDLAQQAPNREHRRAALRAVVVQVAVAVLPEEGRLRGRDDPGGADAERKLPLNLD